MRAMASRPVTVTLSHEHSKAEARERIEAGFDQLMGQVGSLARIDRSWSGDTLSFRAKAMMQTVTGDVTVLDDHVRVTVVLPGLLASMAEKVTGSIERQGQILLEKK